MLVIKNDSWPRITWPKNMSQDEKTIFAQRVVLSISTALFMAGLMTAFIYFAFKWHDDCVEVDTMLDTARSLNCTDVKPVPFADFSLCGGVDFNSCLSNVTQAAKTAGDVVYASAHDYAIDCTEIFAGVSSVAALLFGVLRGGQLGTEKVLAARKGNPTTDRSSLLGVAIQ